MLLKKYRGPDLASALAKAHAEMGPDALVLDTKEVRASLGLNGIEVTVGARRRRQPGGIRGADALRRLALEIKELRGRPHQQRQGTNPPVDDGSTERSIRSTVDQLVAAGLSRDLATRFSLAAERELAGAGGAAGAVRAARRGMEAVLPFAAMPDGARCLFIVGPPGCGKTTTAAKLAGRRVARTCAPVHFATADAERIGAMEQACIFARHLGASLSQVQKPADLLRTLDRIDVNGTVLVDTPGIGSHDGERMESVAALRAAVPEAEVALVLPAGIRSTEASRILRRFRPLKPSCFAISRVDDGGGIGEIVTAAASSTIPLAFFTNGHRVPEDIADASPLALTNMMLRADETAAGELR
jgi:flagellar biosynthesis protein FlhF